MQKTDKKRHWIVSAGMLGCCWVLTGCPKPVEYQPINQVEPEEVPHGLVARPRPPVVAPKPEVKPEEQPKVSVPPYETGYYLAIPLLEREPLTTEAQHMEYDDLLGELKDIHTTLFECKNILEVDLEAEIPVDSNGKPIIAGPSGNAGVSGDDVVLDEVRKSLSEISGAISRVLQQKPEVQAYAEKLRDLNQEAADLSGEMARLKLISPAEGQADLQAKQERQENVKREIVFIQREKAGLEERLSKEDEILGPLVDERQMLLEVISEKSAIKGPDNTLTLVYINEMRPHASRIKKVKRDFLIRRGQILKTLYTRQAQRQP